MLELARASDWEAVRRLSVQIHELHAAWRPDIYFSCEEPYPLKKFLQDISQRMVYVAKSGSDIIGYVVLSMIMKDGPGIVAKNQLRIDSICVDSNFRGQGIGRAMMRDVRALSKAFGCREILLGVHPENDKAIAYYQKCGFNIRTIHMDMKL